MTVNGLFASIWYAAAGIGALETCVELGIVLIAVTATFGIVRLLVTASAVPVPVAYPQPAAPETPGGVIPGCAGCSSRPRALVSVD